MTPDLSNHRSKGERDRSWEDRESLLGVDEAREQILAAFSPLPELEVPLLDSVGLVLAEDVIADQDIPPFRNSAMDGYAVRSIDTSSATPTAPCDLRVVADIPAGTAPFLSLEPGQAARIMTGAALPDGADAVVRFEETAPLVKRAEGSEPDALVRLIRPIEEWENVRQAGEDIASGDTVIRRGVALQAAEIGLLASLNRSTVRVHRRPRIGILSTGDEVIDLGPELQPGQIRNSNSYTIAALVQTFGAEPIMLGVARDQVADVRAKLRAASDVDLLVTSGGVSLGDYDMVKDVLQSEGEINLWQVRIKPGKPMAFGRIGNVPLLGLPGNPVAAYVAFLQFGRPAILKMLGHKSWAPRTLKARLTCEHENRGQRRHYVRGIVQRSGDDYVVSPAGSQGSGVLTSVARANCFIVLPEEWDHASTGSWVDVELLDPGASI